MNVWRRHLSRLLAQRNPESRNNRESTCKSVTISPQSLEPRIFYSASPIPLELATSAQQPAPLEHTLTQLENLVEAYHDPQSPTHEFPLISGGESDAQTKSTTGRALFVLDQGIGNVNQLADELRQYRPDAEVWVIGQQEGGVDAITEWLQRSDQLIQELHLLSHGSVGTIQLGADQLTIETLDQWHTTWSVWQKYLTADADLLIYGCDVAAGFEGQEFIAQWGQRLQVDIAASSDLTAINQTHTDGVLEFQWGTVEATSVFSEVDLFTWQGTLSAPVTVDSANAQETNARDRGSHQSVAMNADGSYVVVWSEQNRDGSGWGVFGQRFDASGAARGAEFQINQFTAGDQRWASVDVAANGNFVVTWTSSGQDGDQQGVYVRRFNDQGTALGNETRVNVTTTGIQQNSTIDVNQDGSFAIAWEGNGSGDSYGIFVRRFNAAGNALAGEQLITTASAGAQSDAAIATNSSGQIIVAWDDSAGFHAQRMSAAGNLVGGRVTIDAASTSGNGDIWLNADGSFAAVWRETVLTVKSIYLRLYDANSVAISGDIAVVGSLLFDHESPSISGTPSGEYLVVWQGANLTDAGDIYLRTYDANGSSLQSSVVVNNYTAGTQSMAAVSANSLNHYVVVWSGATATDASGISSELVTKPSGTDGTVIATEDISHVFSLANFGYSDPLGRPLTGILISEIKYGIVQVGGVNVTAGTTISATDISAGRVSFILGDHQHGLLTKAISFKVVNASGPSNTTHELDFDVRAKVDGVLASAGTGLSVVESGYLVPETLLGSQQNQQMAALAGGGYVVVWQSTDGYLIDGNDGTRIVQQQFDDQGQRVGSEQVISVAGGNNQLRPSVAALHDGGWIVVWEETFGGSTDIFAQRFNPLGQFTDLTGSTLAVGATRVNLQTSANQIDADVIALSGGGFLISWATRDGAWTTDTSSEIVARVFDRGGNGSSEFLVNQLTAGVQRNPKWTHVGDGKVVASWINQNGDGFDVRGRMFDLTQASAGNEFSLSQSTSGRQAAQQVLSLGDGRWIAVWHSETGDGSGYGIFARTFSNTGTAIGSNDVLINQTTLSDQLNPHVVVLPNGGFVFVWQSATSDGSGSDIFARRFDTTLVALGDEMRLNNPRVLDQMSPRAIWANGQLVATWQTNQAQLADSVGALDIVMGTWVLNVTGSEDQVIQIPLGLGFIDRDGSEQLVQLSVSGIPMGFQISDGNNTASVTNTASLDITAWNHATLRLTPPGNWYGEFLLELELSVQDGADLSNRTQEIQVVVNNSHDTPIRANWTDAVDSDNSLTWNGDHWSNEGLDPDEGVLSPASTAAWLEFQLAAGVALPINGLGQMTWAGSGTHGSGQILWQPGAAQQPQLVSGRKGEIATSIQTNGTQSGILNLSSLSSSQFAVELWIRPDNLTQHSVLWDWGGADDGFAVYQTGNTVSWLINQNNQQLGAASNALELRGGQLSAVDFNQIVIVWDEAGNHAGVAGKSDAFLYVNGRLVDQMIDLNVIGEIEADDFNDSGAVGFDERWAGLGGVNGNAVQYLAGTHSSYLGEIGRVAVFAADLQANEILSRYADISQQPLVVSVEGQALTLGQTVHLTSGSTIAQGFDGNFTFTPGSQYATLWSGQTVVETFAYQIQDAEGNATTVNVSVTITGTNDNFLIEQSLPANANSPEDTIYEFSVSQGNPITIGDSLPSDTYFQVKLTTTVGTLQLSSLNGIVIVAGANRSGDLTLVGLESDLNAALDGLQFLPNLNYVGAATISVQTSRAAGLVGAYRFEDGAANDTSLGTPQNGELRGNAHVVTDVTRGQVMSLDGSNDSVRIRDLFDEPRNVTLSAWVNLVTADTGGAEVISLGDNVGLRLDEVAGGLGVSGFFYDGSTWRYTGSSQFIAGTGWHHVAYVFDDVANQQRLYLDGIEIAASSFSASISYSRSHFSFIGAHGNNDINFDFNGKIDDAFVFSRALQAHEIMGLAQDDLVQQGATTLTITPINDAPVIVNHNLVVNEGDSNVVVSTSHLLASDADHSASQITYQIDQLPVYGTVRLNGVALSLGGQFTQEDVNQGRLTYSHDGSENFVDGLRLRVSDGINAPITVTLNVQVNPVNDLSPTITSYGGLGTATISVNENETAVGQVTAVDPEQPLATLSYSIVGGADALLFSINTNTGVIRFRAAPNAESPRDANSDNLYQVVVQVSDGINTAQQSLRVQVGDVDEFDVMNVRDVDLGVNQINENAAQGSSVGLQVAAEDRDQTNSTITFQLQDDAGGRFQIDAGTGIVTVAQGHLLDREQAAFYDIVVRADSSDGSFAVNTFRIHLVDVNEFAVSPVTDHDSIVNRVAENAAAGSGVGLSAWAEDLDATQNGISFRLLDDAGGRFVINPATGAVTVADDADLDFESQSTFIIRVEARSMDGSIATADFTIGIDDVREMPTLRRDHLLVAEGGFYTSATGWLLANDLFEDQVAYTVHLATAPTQGTVQIDSDGTIRYQHAGGENRTDVFWYEVRDAWGVVGTARVDINVLPIDDAPVAVSDGPLGMISGAANAIDLAAILRNDFDVDSPLGNIQIVSGPSQGLLVQNQFGQWLYTSQQNFSGSDTFQYVVESNGKLSNVATVSLQVVTGGPAPVNSNDGPTSGTSGSGSGNNAGSSGNTNTNTNEPTTELPTTTTTTDTPPVKSNLPVASQPVTNNTTSGTNPTSSSTTPAANGGIGISSNNSSGTATFLTTVGYTINDAVINLTRFKTEYGLQRSSQNGTDLEQTEAANILVTSELLQRELLESSEFLKYMRSLRKDKVELFNLSNYEVAQLAPTTAVSLFTVGYVAWLVRGGVLLTSFMTSLPSWQAFDPLPVLETTRLGKDDGDTSIEELVDGSTESEPLELADPTHDNEEYAQLSETIS